MENENGFDQLLKRTNEIAEQERKAKENELLDYFAAKAMQAFICIYPREMTMDYKNIALISYDMAEAMIKEREKRLK